MHAPKYEDAAVRARLKQWPQCPPGSSEASADPHARPTTWLRGRPSELNGAFLRWPGSLQRLRTKPDGLWLNFGGSPRDFYVDIFAIEACCSLSNLQDKRSRFAPSTQSLLAVCPLSWLLAPVSAEDATPRWQATRIMRREPDADLCLPVRDIRVMYALRDRHFQDMLRHAAPGPHEFFVPMDRLIAADSHQDPDMRSVISYASASRHFMAQPGA